MAQEQQENTPLPTFATLIQEGREQVAEITKNVTDVDGFITEHAPKGGVPLLKYLHEIHITNNMSYPGYLMLGSVLVQIALPESITEKPLTDADIEEAEKVFSATEALGGASGWKYISLLKLRFDDKWEGFSDWLGKEAEDLVQLDQLKNAGDEGREEILWNFVVGAYVAAIPYFKRTEKEGFDKHHS